MHEDLLAHLIKQAAAQQATTEERAYRGHIATYDATLHRVRVIIPTLRDQNDNPVLSGWMPLGTPFVGSGFGIQVVPTGGATLSNPTAGEQVLVGLFDPRVGISAVHCMFYTEASPPPGALLQTSGTPLQAGEVVIQSSPGSFMRMHANGDCEFTLSGSSGKTIINAQNGIDVSTNLGDVNVTAASGTVTVTANAAVIAASAITLCKSLADAVQGLCTQAFATFFAAHIHPTPSGNSGVPIGTVPANAVTSTVKAE